VIHTQLNSQTIDLSFKRRLSLVVTVPIRIDDGLSCSSKSLLFLRCEVVNRGLQLPMLLQ
jgi:hypothetical protein